MRNFTCVGTFFVHHNAAGWEERHNCLNQRLYLRWPECWLPHEEPVAPGGRECRARSLQGLNRCCRRTGRDTKQLASRPSGPQEECVKSEESVAQHRPKFKSVNDVKCYFRNPGESAAAAAG